MESFGRGILSCRELMAMFTLILLFICLQQAHAESCKFIWLFILSLQQLASYNYIIMIMF